MGCARVAYPLLKGCRLAEKNGGVIEKREDMV